jgi:hypothetical protein
MKISGDHIAAVESLGYTPDEARFPYIAATYSGYFVPRQFIAFAGVKWGKRSDHFTRKLESRGHATWREYPHLDGVYHLFSKTLYRVIDKESLRNNRRHSIEFIRTRLVLLDFVLANQHYDYLETESDKVSYFRESLGIPTIALPAKPYAGSSHLEPTLRYFVDKFPLFRDATGDSAGAPVTLSYVDAGAASLAGFRHHLDAYKPLLSSLPEFHFLYLSDSTVHFAGAQRCFAAFANRTLRDNPSAEILRYFRLRAAWDQKQYGQFSNEAIEWLNQATARFDGDDTERLYGAWSAGDLTDDGLASRLGDNHTPRHFRFAAYLVANGPKTDKELEKAG